MQNCVLVAGATGGIGSAYCKVLAQQVSQLPIVRLARQPDKLTPLKSSTVDITCDITHEESIEQAVKTIPEHLAVSHVFIATGLLHDDGMSPEKTFRSLQADKLTRAYIVNAIGPSLLVKHLSKRLTKQQAAKIGILSARVGSISDNRLGGWHAYRASKAALNMLIKNFAIEFARKKPHHIIVGLQPGTTDTPLSKPFQQGLPEGQLQSPEFTAEHLFDVMTNLTAEDSGQLFDYLGIKFEP